MNAPDPTRILRLHLPLVSHEIELVETEGMTVLGALTQIRASLPHSLQDAFICHAGACNTCNIRINGKAALACTTFTRDLAADIAITPGVHAVGWGELRDDTRVQHG